MEQHSQTSDTGESRAILEGQLREGYGRTVYSHKTHEKCADILQEQEARIKALQIALSAVTTAGFVGVVFGAGAVGALIGSVVSTVLLALNAYTKSSDLGGLAQKHRQAANDLWLIRERQLSLLVDVGMNQKPIESLQDQRDKLIEQLHAVYGGAPSTNFKAYTRAQRALQHMEDMTFKDEEIDAFLPNELKRTKRTTGAPRSAAG